MDTLTSPFVRRARASFGRDDFQSVDHPSWPDTAKMLDQCNERGGRLDLQGETETEMTVFAENGAYHVTVSVDETDYYLAWNASEPTRQTLDVFGHSFERHQILKDIDVLRDIIKTFWATGTRSERVVWLHETLEG